jgi:hypothetical protein
MLAYKCLAPGAVGPFTGFAWPAPASGGPGPWVTAPSDEPHRWIHVCRVEDLPYWLCEELWKVELDGPIREAPMQLAAPRARLVERVSGWTAATAHAMGEAVSARLQELSGALLDTQGLSREAALIRAASSFDAIREAARAVRAGGGASVRTQRIAEYAADAVYYLDKGEFATVLYVAANAAVVHDGSPAAAVVERQRQAAWLVERLGL